ncbi:hypothetical protein E3D37_27860, partial [Burkholderia cepacia]
LAGSCPPAPAPAIAKLRSTLNVSCQRAAHRTRSVLQSPDTRQARGTVRAPGDNGATPRTARASRPR